MQSIGVNTRVLVIGAHPDDEDTFLISWLSRGRGVETAYLSLTRGDGGQNLIGNELGEPLGVIRTEELLAARRVDGALQYFTRAYDFGFSKDTLDTYAHWPRDSILGDVIRVVRAFQPHVIVAVFSGTPRDGHGHHQVSGLLARAAYDLAGDSVRYPTRLGYGPPWTPLKFYRAARFSPETATLRFDVGEYSPLLGRSYAEIAGESRSQHKSQGFGAPQRKGSIIDMLAREATRVNPGVAATGERSLFDGIDTTWSRFRGVTRSAGQNAWIDTLTAGFAAIKAAFDPMRPEKLLGPLNRVYRILDRWRQMSSVRDADLRAAVSTTWDRVVRAMQLASGVEVEALAPRELHPVGATARAVVTVYNRGALPITTIGPPLPVAARGNISVRPRRIEPGSSLVDTVDVPVDELAQPWWLTTPRAGAMFTQPVSFADATRSVTPSAVDVTVQLDSAGPRFPITEPVVFREVDPVRGETRRAIAGTVAIALTVDQQTQLAPANVEFVRDFNVKVSSADTRAREVRVHLDLPAGLSVDSVERRATLPSYGSTRSLTFRLRGRLSPGTHRIAAIAESDGERFTTGYQLIDYDHIRRQRVYRAASSAVSAIDMRVPAALRVAYVPGVGDNVAPMLAQLGIPVTVIPAAEIARADLTPYSTVVIGPRAYEAHPDLAAANPQLFGFVRRGGTMVVQYGQMEMTQPGVMPYPVTLARPADRVTEEDAVVTVDAPTDPLLTAPNAIRPVDWAGWVQERALYMPRTFDDHYRSLLSMNDRGEQPNRAAILATQLDRGTYVYTTLSFFRQVPAGVPGPVRLFVNLLSANLPRAVNP